MSCELYTDPVHYFFFLMVCLYMKAVFSLHPPALHLTMQLGHISCARVLLEDSNANLFAVNMKYVCVCVCVYICIYTSIFMIYCFVTIVDRIACTFCPSMPGKMRQPSSVCLNRWHLISQSTSKMPRVIHVSFTFDFPLSRTHTHTHTHTNTCVCLCIEEMICC